MRNLAWEKFRLDLKHQEKISKKKPHKALLEIVKSKGQEEEEDEDQVNQAQLASALITLSNQLSDLSAMVDTTNERFAEVEASTEKRLAMLEEVNTAALDRIELLEAELAATRRVVASGGGVEEAARQGGQEVEEEVEEEREAVRKGREVGQAAAEAAEVWG
jgi:hypothetical protein